MMHVAYTLDNSKKHGIGLFAGQDIAKGTLVYTASPILDVDITQEKFEALSESEQKEVSWWGFWDESTQRWHVDFDVSKFVNHETEGTLTQDDQFDMAHLITTKDIKKGCELTQNYLEFETEEDLQKRGIVL